MPEFRLSRAALETMVEHAVRDKPVEACGYLAASIDSNDGCLAIAMTNVDKSGEHFSLDPAEQFKVMKELRGKSMRIIGVYHSHPETPSRPSEEDLKLAYDPSLHYLIVSLAQQEPVTNSFRIRNGQAEKETLTLY